MKVNFACASTSILVLFSTPAVAQSQARLDCNLLTEIVAMTAMWRDNGVPLSKSQANVDQVLNRMPATPEDHMNWRRTVSAIYDSKVTPEQIEKRLKPTCPD